MAHFAEIIDGVVQRVIVAEQDFIDSIPGQWVQTSYNTRGGQHPEGRPLRKNYAGIGHVYDSVRDAFYAPQPHLSWTLDEETCFWNPPTPYPADGNAYAWNEESLSWVAVS
jgi:hypothetical protein